MSSRGHSAIIIRAFSQGTTLNVKLLNRAHMNILFILLFFFSSRILKPRGHLLLQIWSIWPGNSDTTTRRKKKEKDGIGVYLDLATRNHYQRARGKDQNGTYSPCIDEPLFFFFSRWRSQSRPLGDAPFQLISLSHQFH